MDLTETYIDTVTGYLHVTLNELFKLKANYTVLENEHEELIKNYHAVQAEFGQNFATLTDKQKQVDELTALVEKQKRDFSAHSEENSSMKGKLAQLNVFAEQIANLKTLVGQKDEEIDKYIEMIASLREPSKLKRNKTLKPKE